MKPSENAQAILEKRYFINGEDWDGLCRRVASSIATNPEREEEYFNALNNFYFLPNSPTLMNSGTSLNNLSACFVLPISDSMESIMDTAKNMAMVFKSGGGVGIDLSNLREENSIVAETNGVASGVVSFMELYNTVADTVKQGGKRRAALLCSLRVDHPEILKFINAKNDKTKFNNCNISVAITDDFMKAAQKGDDYDLISPKNGVVGQLNAREVFELIAKNAHDSGEPGLLFIHTANRLNPVPQFGRLNTTNPCVTGDTKILTSEGNIEISKLIDKEVSIWNGYEWSNVVPRITGYNQEILDIEFDNGSILSCTPYHKLILHTKYGGITNCLAQHVEIGDVCDFVDAKIVEDKENSDKSMISINKQIRVTSIKKRATLEDIVYCVTEPKRNNCVFNNILTKNCGEIYLSDYGSCNLGSINMKLIKSSEQLEKYVRLGVRFLNDVVDKGHYPLDEISKVSTQTRKIGLGIMGFADWLALQDIAYDSQTGRNKAEELMKFIYDIANDESKKILSEMNTDDISFDIKTIFGDVRYNSTLLCCAPTGTISMIADCSSGIEPYFALSYTKTVMDGKQFKYVNDILQKKLEEEGLWCSEVKAQIMKTGSIQNIDTIPDSIKKVFKTANEISVGGHVKMQAALQKYVDNSISKTINLPNSATVDDVMLAYCLAYETQTKGITVYRDGSRNNQVLSSPKSKIEKCPECGKHISHESGCITCVSCGWSACST